MTGSDAALLLRDYVNTLDLEDEIDELTTPEQLTGWLAGRGLLDDGQGPASEAELAAARSLREGLQAALLGHHGPGEPGFPARLEAELARLPLRVSLAGDAPALIPAGAGVPAALARLAAAIMASVADGSWRRLKVCQEDTCRWAFLDTSKNRSRAWCSMRICGNRTKTRAYRARRRPPVV